jgi:hypothetical protein
MVDEWSEIEKKISSPHLVFRRPLGLEEKSVGGLPSQTYLKEKLSSEQELVYNLVDGTRTVQEIIDRSLLGKFNASEILVDLSGMGLIETAGTRAPSLIKKVSMVNFREALAFVYYGAFLVFIFFLLVYFKPDFLYHFWDSRIERADIEVPMHVVHKAQLDRVKNALELYYLEKGQYPSRLEELISAKLLQESDLFYRKGVSYQYELKDGKYLLKH